MLVFVGIWLLLIATCFPIGVAILQLTQADCFTRSGERFIISVWLGVVLLADALLATSLFFPLSLPISSLLAAALVAGALMVKGVGAEIRTALQSLRKVSPVWKFGLVALLATVAYVATAGVVLYDAHLYHFQVIQWLSQVGLVPGLALLHNRFSFTSSWFAIAAPFNIGVLEARISAVMGGFALLLIALHVFISLSHLLEDQKRSQDWLIVAATFIYLPFMMHSTLVVSPSPDLPAIALVVLVAWAMLVIGGQPQASEGKSVGSDRLVPVLLAAGAMAIKLSMAILLPITVLHYALANRRLNLRALVLSSLLGLGLVLPVLGFGLMASGCPLYPSPTLCQDVPWSVGAEEAKRISSIIRIWPRWGGPPPENATAWGWILPWMQYHLNASVLIGLSLAALGLLVALGRQIPHPGFYSAGMVGLLGTAFVFYGSPTLRFGLGYFCILPALAIALVARRHPATAIALLGTVAALSASLRDEHKGFKPAEYSALVIALFTYLIWLAAWLSRRQSHSHSPLLGNFIMAIAFCFLSLGAGLPHVLHSENADRALLPPQMPKLRAAQRVRHRTRGVKYLSPVDPLQNDLCRAAPIPCMPYLTHKDITLRNRQQGIEGGFVRASLKNQQPEK